MEGNSLPSMLNRWCWAIMKEGLVPPSQASPAPLGCMSEGFAARLLLSALLPTNSSTPRQVDFRSLLRHLMTEKPTTDPPTRRNWTKAYWGKCTVCTYRYLRYAAYITSDGNYSVVYCAACAEHALGWKKHYPV